MNNQLIKTTYTIYAPGSPGYPASPGQPWIPAHTVVSSSTRMEAQYQDEYRFIPPSQLEGRSLAENPYGMYLFIGRRITGYVPVITYTYTYVQEQPYLPPSGEVPAIASQTVIDKNLGWNSSAGSVVALQRSGFFSFRVSSTTGIFVGFSPDYLTSGYMRIAFGIHFARGIAQAYVFGAPVGSPMTYSLDDTFAVERFAGEFVAWIGGAELHSMPATDEVMHLVVSIYAGGDFIYDPQFVTEDYSGASASLPALTSGANWSTKHSAVSFLPLTTEARNTTRAEVSFQPLVGMSANFGYAEGRGALPALRSASEGGMLVPGFAYVECMLLPIMVGGTGLTGEVGQAYVALPPLDTLSANHAYGEAAVALQPLGVICSAYEGAGNATMMTIAVASEVWDAPTVAYLAWSETLGAAVAFATDRVVDALYDEYADLGLVFSITAELGAQLMSTVQAGFATPLFDTAGNVWVVTPDGKTTRYEQFDYTGYAKINGRQYGVKADGVYLLEGDNDDGLPIQAAIGLGKQDFGTTLQKSVTACYLGVGSSGRMFMKIIANGQDYLYEARQDSETVMAQRVDPGKGLKATFMDFIVYNSGGADFELSSVEFVAIPLGRRI